MSNKVVSGKEIQHNTIFSFIIVVAVPFDMANTTKTTTTTTKTAPLHRPAMATNVKVAIVIRAIQSASQSSSICVVVYRLH